MQKLLFACALSAALFGCKKKDEAAKGEAPECIGAATQASPLFLAGAKKAKPDTKVTELELAGHINATCTLDNWPAEAIKCFDGVKSDADLTACTKKLSKDQSDKLDKAVLEAFAGESAGSAAPPPAAPPPAAEGSGSAAAPAEGSAAAPAEGSAAGSGSGS